MIFTFFYPYDLLRCFKGIRDEYKIAFAKTYYQKKNNSIYNFDSNSKHTDINVSSSLITLRLICERNDRRACIYRTQKCQNCGMAIKIR